MADPSQDAVLRHTRVETQFYDIHGSGRTLTTYAGRNAVLRHSRVGTHFNDIHRSGRSFMTYTGQDTFL